MLPKSAFLRRTLATIMVKFGGVGLSFLVTVALVQALGSEGFGAYSFAFACVTILAIPVQAGLPSLVVRETARARARADWSRMRSLWLWGSKLLLIMSLLIAVVAYLAITLLPLPFLSDIRRGALVMGLMLFPIMAFNQVRGAALRGLKLPILGALPDQIIRPAFLLLAVLALPLAGFNIGAEAAMQFHAMASLAAFFVGAYWLMIKQPIEVRNALPVATDQGGWLKALLPFSLIAGIQILLQNTNIVILGIFKDDSAVAIFRTALVVAKLTAIGLTAVVFVAQPYVTEAFAKGDRDRVEMYGAGTAAFGTAVTVPLTLFLWLFGETLLGTVFGAEFSSAYVTLIILAVGQAINAFFGAVVMLLIMSGNESRTAFALVATLVFNLVLNLALIPPFGAEGAAIATSISMFAQNFVMWFLVKRTLRVNALPFSVWRHIRRRGPRESSE